MLLVFRCAIQGSELEIYRGCLRYSPNTFIHSAICFCCSLYAAFKGNLDSLVKYSSVKTVNASNGTSKRHSFLCKLSRGIILNASSVRGKKQKEKELQIIKLNTWLKSSVSLLSSVESKKLVSPPRTNILKQGDRSNKWRSAEIKIFCGVEMLY